MRLLRRAEYRSTPWKNGMGITDEVMSWPPGSDVAGFDWRLSIAHVGVDGPFSVFPGVDRTIALLEGDGLFLDLAGRTVELTPDTQPFSFSGDLEISSRNKAGPTIDLNIMSRRGRFRHDMRRIGAGPYSGPTEPASAAFLVFISPGVLEIDGTIKTVDRYDTLMLEADDLDIRIDFSTDVISIHLFQTA